MAVETRPTSRFWYGRWQENGARKCKRLGVRVQGEPGSEEFETSRGAAEEELRALVEEARIRRHPEDVVQRLHEVKFGRRIGSISLNRLAAEWAALPRKKPMGAARLRYGTALLGRFVEFLAAHHPKVKEMAGVSAEMAEAFMAHEEKRSLRPASYNAELSLLRGAFERLRVKAGMLANPFEGSLVLKDLDTVSRVPFTLPELAALFDAAKVLDSEIHDLIVVGACTALRRGDACCLKWADVNLERNRIRVRTRKTGGAVVIPILPRLRAVLEQRPRKGRFVFPSLAAAYESSPWEINNRLRRVFVECGLGTLTRREEVALEKPAPAVVDLDDDEAVRARVLARIEALTPAQVSPRVKGVMREVFDLYSSGVTLCDVAKQLEVSKGSVSNYLARIERVAGHPVVRKEVAFARKRKALAALPRASEEGARPAATGRVRVNTRGFHALRATFATQALAAGVPVEVVKLVTGHSLAETILRHYFNPDEDTMLGRLERAMPRLLAESGGAAGSLWERAE